MGANEITLLFFIAYSVRHGFEALLDALQAGHLAGRRDRVPRHLEGKVDIETVRKSVEYNRDKLRLSQIGRAHGAIGVVVMVAFGFSFLDGLVSALELGPVTSALVFFAALALVGGLYDLPLELAAVFGVESKHGFNRQSLGGFFLDKMKGILVGGVLGGILLAAVLFLMVHMDRWWWLAAFAAVALIQLAATWLYPILIMPLFNKFAPVEGELKEAIGALAAKVRFPLRDVQTMDGSKRSAHSNAFFIGLFGARRIVLYDTLVEKLEQEQLVAVLAHELGHFRLGHLYKRLAAILVGMLCLFALLGWMEDQPSVYSGLGFEQMSPHAALVVFGLLVGELLAPAGWFMRIWSRKDEHDADRFAAKAVDDPEQLIEALVRLTKQNLSSPGSHRLYRNYYNSHPSLKERMQAIRAYASRSR